MIEHKFHYVIDYSLHKSNLKMLILNKFVQFTYTHLTYTQCAILVREINTANRSKHYGTIHSTYSWTGRYKKSVHCIHTVRFQAYSSTFHTHTPSHPLECHSVISKLIKFMFSTDNMLLQNILKVIQSVSY